jgi:glycosyltransferase involved in cell wall biosynthesis
MGESPVVFKTIDELNRIEFEKEIIILTFKTSESAQDHRLPDDLNNFRILRYLSLSRFERQFNWIIILITILFFRPQMIHIINPTSPGMGGGALGEGLISPVLLARIIGIPVVVSLHTTYDRKRILRKITQRVSNYPIRWFVFRYVYSTQKLLLSLANRIFIYSENERDKRVSIFCQDYGLSTDSISLELNRSPPIITTNKKKPAELALLNGPYLLSLGFFREGKGFELCIESFEKLSQGNNPVNLVIAGPVKSEWIAYHEKINLIVQKSPFKDRIYLIPRFLEEEELLWLYTNSLAFLALYRDTQGPSDTAKIAKSLAVPTLLLDTQEMREYVGEEFYEWVNADPNLISESLSRILSNNSGPGKTFNESQENWFKKVAEEWKEAYDNLVNSC